MEVTVLILVQFVRTVVELEALLRVVVVAERAAVVLVTVFLQGRQAKAFTQDQVISVLTDKGMTAVTVVEVLIQQVLQAVVVVVAAPAGVDQVMVLVDRVAVAQLSLLVFLQWQHFQCLQGAAAVVTASCRASVVAQPSCLA